MLDGFLLNWEPHIIIGKKIGKKRNGKEKRRGSLCACGLGLCECLCGMLFKGH
jgi:hypothetical protein